MSSILYKIDAPGKFSQNEKLEFCDLLVKQGRVHNPSVEKINRCQKLCIGYFNSKIITVGAIKPKTASDFSKAKADLPHLVNDFHWELGYLFTEKEFRGNGYCSNVVNMLMNEKGRHNLMASTDINSKNPMIAILGKFGFNRLGKEWNSSISTDILGLFLLYKNKSIK